MIVTVLGDIHGNLPALERVLEAELAGTDQWICHGDVVNYGPWSNECVHLLETIPNTVRLVGNHEIYFLSGTYPGSHPVARLFFEHCFPDFTAFDEIGRYQASYKVGDFLIQHTLEDRYLYLDTPVHIEQNCIVGHSHHQFERAVDGFRLYNTGSVGQNRIHINVINYLQIDTVSGLCKFKAIIYDVDCVINEMKARKYPKVCIEYYQRKPRA